ncbi:MAG TPA: hypothetical protein ENI79_06405 [Rhodospirillales bacterium]|nr:hypothetical protein [Rhodospirillales bacterium]
MDVAHLAAYMVTTNTALARREAAIGMVKQNIEAMESIAQMVGEAGNLATQGRGQVINITV